MKTIWKAAVVAVLAMGVSACGDDPVDTLSSTCNPGGTYIMEFATRSNTCPSEVFDTSAITSLREEITFEASACGSDSYSFDFGDPPQGCEFKGLLTVDSTPDGPEDGQVKYSFTCGENACEAVFRVDFTKQK